MTKEYIFWVYILTNPNKSVLYVGVTNNLTRRLEEHKSNRGNSKTFAGRYFCYNLIYYEVFEYIDLAAAREKEIKKWSRSKKEALINTWNPKWKDLNENFIE